MTRIRLREARSEQEEQALYARTYPGGYRHDVWPDHVERVQASVRMIENYARHIRTAADLSCGDAAILREIPELDEVWIGDLNGPPRGDLVPQANVSGIIFGALPGSLRELREPVDLYVLSETLEHMDDPDELLRNLAGCARYLFLSTPLSESPDTGNVEHYWSWGQADIHEMLLAAGWNPMEFQRLVPRSTLHLPNAYTYQLWMAVSA